MPDPIAICQNPNGEGQYVPAESVTDGKCFMPGCECTPLVYTPNTTSLEAENARLRTENQELQGAVDRLLNLGMK